MIARKLPDAIWRHDKLLIGKARKQTHLITGCEALKRSGVVRPLAELVVDEARGRSPFFEKASLKALKRYRAAARLLAERLACAAVGRLAKRLILEAARRPFLTAGCKTRTSAREALRRPNAAAWLRAELVVDEAWRRTPLSTKAKAQREPRASDW